MSEITVEALRPFDDNNTGAILAAFELFGTPKRMLDFGSGSGIMAKVARDKGVRAIGIDILASPPDLKHDLREPLFLDDYVDFIISVETAEHLPESAANTFVDSICRHLEVGGVLVFTAAVPGQNGSGHINCREKNYWRRKFTQRGLRFNDGATKELAELWYQKAGGISAWIAPNVQVFDR